MRIIEEQIKSNPQLFDKPIEAYKKGLLESLSWLDQSFGRVWRNIRNVGGKKYTEPCVYTHGNEYETLTPSDDLGNYCFWVLKDPTEVGEYGVSVNVSIIFWVNLERVFDKANVRDTEVLKNDIIRVLTQDIWYKGSTLEVSRIYEDGKNVFNGFTLDENDNQFMMHPYAAFRVDGELITTIPTC